MSITSRLKAEVKIKNKKKKIKISKYIRIIPSSKLMLFVDISPITKELKYLITKCFCWEVGYLKIKLILKRNVFAPG